MHSSIALLATSAILPAVFARPQMVFPPDSRKRYCPVIDSTEDVTGDPWQVGPSGKGGITLTVTESHEIGTSWTIGGDVGVSVDQVLGVGGSFSASVTKSVADSTAEGAERECPDGKWSCSLMIYPGMKKVKGHLEEMKGNDAGCDVNPVHNGGDFELLIPFKSEAGNPTSSVQECVCGNLEGANDEGHPELVCMSKCVEPKKN